MSLFNTKKELEKLREDHKKLLNEHKKLQEAFEDVFAKYKKVTAGEHVPGDHCKGCEHRYLEIAHKGNFVFGHVERCALDGKSICSDFTASPPPDEAD